MRKEDQLHIRNIADDLIDKAERLHKLAGTEPVQGFAGDHLSRLRTIRNVAKSAESGEDLMSNIIKLTDGIFIDGP